VRSSSASTDTFTNRAEQQPGFEAAQSVRSFAGTKSIGNRPMKAHPSETSAYQRTVPLAPQVKRTYPASFLPGRVR
jgi:hypothetical protein